MKKVNYLLTIIYLLLGYTLLVSVFLFFYCNKRFDEKSFIKTNTNYLQIKESYLVKYSEFGEKISNDKSFVILDCDSNIDKNNLFLKINNDYYVCDSLYEKYFTNYSDNPYVFVVDDYNIGNEMGLVYNFEEEKTLKNYYVKIKPLNLLDKSIYIKKLNDDLIINNHYINFNNYVIEKKIIENVSDITFIMQSPNKVILKFIINKLDDLDEFTKYGKIKYVINNVEKEENIILKNDYVINNAIFIEVNSEIISSNKIWLEFNIRNNGYQYFLID